MMGSLLSNYANERQAKVICSIHRVHIWLLEVGFSKSPAHLLSHFCECNVVQLSSAIIGVLECNKKETDRCWNKHLKNKREIIPDVRYKIIAKDLLSLRVVKSRFWNREHLPHPSPNLSIRNWFLKNREKLEEESGEDRSAYRSQNGRRVSKITGE